MRTLQGIEAAPDLTERVYTRLLDAICVGELAAGTRLTQEELAASLNVSRQPVLQALRMLKRDGAAVDVGRRGLVVAPVEPGLIEDVYEVRGALDGLAARLAARAGARIDPGLIDRGRAALARGESHALLEADVAFHNAIYAASGNPLIADSAKRHWHHVRRAIGGVLRVRGPREWVWDEHEAIVEAIRAGDEERAERCARAHCEAGGRVLAARLKAPGGPGA